MIAKQIGTLAVFNSDNDNELVAVVCKDDKSRKNVFYKCSEMGFGEIEALLNRKMTAKINNEEKI